VELAYFAYGTLQKGFPNWPYMADRLGEPLGRFRTVAPHGLVVPLAAGCPNPGCRLLHRMAALVPDVEGSRVEGDLFEIDEAALTAIDRLEGYDLTGGREGPYVRVSIEVAPLDGGEVRVAAGYRARDPGRWRALVAAGRAELATRYGRELATAGTKRCCLDSPGHAGPHDVMDIFGPG
jgi:gamma-glutamylcyclotransferase (GGCT)/AIG2-like uncharacterized protein YtfP